DVRAHHRAHARADRVLEGNEVRRLQLRERRHHARERLVRILRGATVAGIMLGAGEDAVLLAAAHPHGGMLPDPLRVRAERTGPDDRVLRLQVQIADGSERPGDADGPGFLRGDDGGGVRGVEVVEPAESGWRGAFSEPLDLLGGAALQVRADEQRPASLLAHAARELRDGLPGAAEHDEAAHARRQGRVDGRALVGEAAAAPAQGGKDEPRERRRHANATASLASPSKKRWSNATTGRGRTRAASISTRAGFRAPPPEMTSSASGGAGVQRSSARAIDSTVRAVAVATASLSDPSAFRTRSISRSA